MTPTYQEMIVEGQIFQIPVNEMIITFLQAGSTRMPDDIVLSSAGQAALVRPLGTLCQSLVRATLWRVVAILDHEGAGNLRARLVALATTCAPEDADGAEEGDNAPETETAA